MIETVVGSSDFSDLDRTLCKTLPRISGVTDPPDELILALALVSRAAARGHLCLDLRDIAGKRVSEILDSRDIPTGLKCYPLKHWLSVLHASPAVGAADQGRPLVLDASGRLYLRRYWRYENTIALGIAGRITKVASTIDPDRLAVELDRYFPPSHSPDGMDWQRVAACAAVNRHFAVISGGPGTGKTTTVLKILLLLMDIHGKDLRIAMAAPTGKAASRLMESMHRSVKAMNLDSVKSIPGEAFTLHRLLNLFPGSARSVHDRDNPLPHDVVIVDESSMIDAGLMEALFNAVSEHARLILLGDRDQLAPVEAGSVFGDICDTGHSHIYSPSFSSLIGRACRFEPPPSDGETHPLADSLVVLKHSYRFDSNSGIGLLGSAIREGDGQSAAEILLSGGWKDLEFREMKKALDRDTLLLDGIGSYLASYMAADTPAGAVGALGDSIILSPVNGGWVGVDAINNRMEELLARENLIPGGRRYYRGKPLLVTGNDYPLRLYNGDMGIVWDSPEGRGEMTVYFQGPGGSLKTVVPVKLPVHQSVYAMTVHKSQGSEFNRVLLLLPGVSSPLLSRELLYTAVTRAREKIIIAGSIDVVKSMVDTPLRRVSGLRDALWS